MLIKILIWVFLFLIVYLFFNNLTYREGLKKMKKAKPIKKQGKGKGKGKVKATDIDVGDEDVEDVVDVVEDGEAAPANGSPTLTSVAADVETLKLNVAKLMEQNAQIAESVLPTVEVTEEATD